MAYYSREESDCVEPERAVDYGRLAFEDIVHSRDGINARASAALYKMASIVDQDLFDAAALVRPDGALEYYEQLGGRYKTASPEERAFVGRAFMDKGKAEAAWQRLDAADAALEALDTAASKKKVAADLAKAPGLARIGQLLTGSRARALGAAKDEAAQDAGRHLLGALKYDPNKVTNKVLGAVHKGKVDKLPSAGRGVVESAGQRFQNHTHAQRAEQLGKDLKDEKARVNRMRAVSAGGLAVGAGAAAVNKTSRDD